MGKVKKQIIVCPKCKKTFEVDVFKEIKLPYDEEQRNKVLENSLFRLKCDDCQVAFSIAYRCQYEDMEHRYLLWVVPKAEYMQGKADKDIEKYNETLKEDKSLRLAQGGYRYRVVHNDNELREKVMMFDEGFDDRYIEAMKLVYAPIIKKKIKEDSKILGIFFDKAPDGKFCFIAVTNNMPPLRADINWDMYEDMKTRLNDVVEKNTPEGLCVIDPKWALDVMKLPVEGEEETNHE